VKVEKQDVQEQLRFVSIFACAENERENACAKQNHAGSERHLLAVLCLNTDSSISDLDGMIIAMGDWYDERQYAQYN
jgi:hypothetical protein